MSAADDPLLAPTASVGYRSVADALHNEEIGIHGNSISGGDSIGLSRSTRRALKPHLILGKAWGRSVKWLKARRRGEHAYRLVDRDGRFYQSVGRWNIRRLKAQADLKKLIGLDPFHSLVDKSTFNIVLGITTMYLSLVLCFAIAYTTISATLGCNLELTSIREGFLFSLETMTTVGYGTNDYLFGSCWIMLPMLSAQAFTGLLIDALLIGILFARLSRPQTRASSVVFTKNAVIRRVRGDCFFMFQVGELRKHQLLEIHVRCYAIRHERLTCDPRGSDGSIGNGVSSATGTSAGIGPRSNSVSSNIGVSRAGAGTSCEAELAAKMPEQVFFQSHSMRLQHPDDELGGNLLLVLPQTVVHRIDAWSPMMPPPRWNSSHGPVQWGLHTDKEITKAPWEEPPPSPGLKRDSSSSAAAAGTTAAAATSAAPAPSAAAEGVGNWGGPALDGLERRISTSAFSSAFSAEGHLYPEQDDTASRREGQLARRRSTGYWDDISVSEFGVNVHEKGADDDAINNIGYVHRFPDLLKRWDDVDGDRGTWYEKMKRRLLRVEMERRRSEEMRKENEKGGKTADEVRAAASRARLARAGFRRSHSFNSSIMHVGGRGPTDNIPDSLAADRKPPSLAQLPEELKAPQHGGSEISAAGSSRGLSDNGHRSVGSVEGGNSSASGGTLSAGQWFAREERKAIDAFVQDRELEVVVILEGTDTSTGNTVQARHSYCWEDILWDRTFASCVTRGQDGACEVDFSKFHDTLPAPANCDDHGFVQSYA